MASVPNRPVAGFDYTSADLEYRKHLPHLVQDNVIYFVTFRLHDSIPHDQLRRWRWELRRWEQQNPPPHTPEQEHAFAELGYRRIERWLDRHTGSCLLANPRIHDIIENCLKKCDGDRLWLGDYIIMPNHVHALLTLAEGEHLKTILEAWYAVTTRNINRLTGRTGRLWQDEPFDHIVRDQPSLERVRNYIRHNGHALPPDQWRYGCGKLFLP